VNGITTFSDLQLALHPQLVQNVTKAGLKHPTPIQRHGMPQLMAGFDVMCCSHTGSGKTASYLLPIIDKLVKGGTSSSSSSPDDKITGASSPFALILSPTHELASQISKDANMFGNGLPVESFAVYGGQNMGYELKRLKVNSA